MNLFVFLFFLVGISVCLYIGFHGVIDPFHILVGGMLIGRIMSDSE